MPSKTNKKRQKDNGPLKLIAALTRYLGSHVLKIRITAPLNSQGAFVAFLGNESFAILSSHYTLLSAVKSI